MVLQIVIVKYCFRNFWFDIYSFVGVLMCLLSVAAGTNLVGKFTQSVRRIVQDVKDEGTASE